MEVAALFAYLAVLFMAFAYDMRIRLERLRRAAGPGRDEAIELLVRETAGKVVAILRASASFTLRAERSEGLILPEAFILVCNHQGVLDAPVLVTALPGHRLRFVAKRQLGRVLPFVSIALRSQGHCLVEREGEMKGAVRALRAFASRCVAEGTCPVVFPEGTRSKDGRLGRFHSAGFRVIATSALPIVVAALDGGWRISSLRDLFIRFSGASYRLRLIRVLEAPAGKAEAGVVLATAWRLIEEALATWRGGT